MTRTLKRSIVVLILLSMTAAPAMAWSAKDHILITRMAARILLEDPATPQPMRHWLRQATPNLGNLDDDRQILLLARVGQVPRGVDGLPYWSVMPDLVADTERPDRLVEPFGVSERMLHFVDLEYFKPGLNQPRYADDLSARPAMADIPRDITDPRWKQAGMLPFRVEDCYNRMVQQIRAGRLNDAPGQFPRDEHATRWAGYLSHYAADNTQPHHGTLDYKSRSYFKDPPREVDPHAALEWAVVDSETDDYLELKQKLWASLVAHLRRGIKDPAASDDPYLATLEVALASYEALPLIGRASVAAWTNDAGEYRPFNANAFFDMKGRFAGEEMTVLDLKARQMALAAQRVARLWRQGWIEATTPQADGAAQPTTQPAPAGR